MTSIEIVTETVPEDVTMDVCDDNDNTDNDSTTTNTSINAIDEPVEMHDVDDELIDKPVRKLTKNEREKLMREYADGVDNK